MTTGGTRSVRCMTWVICVLALGALSINRAVSMSGSDSLFVVEIAPSQNAITPGTDTFKVGDAVELIVKMKNNSRQVLHYALTNPAFNYRLIVLGEDGNPVPETENFRKMKEGAKDRFASGRNILVTLKPQETQQDTIQVNYLYDMSKPGEYIVSLERDMPPELGKGVVQSNTIKIHVVE
jgi:hypothetical protein